MDSTVRFAINNATIIPEKASTKQICDLSRENIPNSSRWNSERNGKQTGDERLGKPFETDTVMTVMPTSHVLLRSV